MASRVAAIDNAVNSLVSFLCLLSLGFREPRRGVYTRAQQRIEYPDTQRNQRSWVDLEGNRWALCRIKEGMKHCPSRGIRPVVLTSVLASSRSVLEAVVLGGVNTDALARNAKRPQWSLKLWHYSVL